MPRRRFHLTFPEHLIHEPVIYTVGKRFDLVTNIRRANVDERSGWMILEMEGDEEAIVDAVGWLTDRGVHVERIDEQA
ncbi:MAG TPA: NIL domain-containing protein [Actinomycetota bacterium]|nr:NIL domain-containing protein [Actinomycetota bacterium]